MVAVTVPVPSRSGTFLPLWLRHDDSQNLLAARIDQHHLAFHPRNRKPLGLRHQIRDRGGHRRKRDRIRDRRPDRGAEPGRRGVVLLKPTAPTAALTACWPCRLHLTKMYTVPYPFETPNAKRCQANRPNERIPNYIMGLHLLSEKTGTKHFVTMYSWIIPNEGLSVRG